ncbi:MAG: cupredoxin domain-containing protein [Actinomycetota bacterium]
MTISPSRVSWPLAICLIGFAVAGLALFRSPETTTPAAPVADAGQPATTADQVAAARIDIAGFAFGGQTTVSTGQTVTVANADGAPHTLTAVDGSFDTGVIQGGASATLTAPLAPGSYAFFCSLHPSMTGTLTVG